MHIYIENLEHSPLGSHLTDRLNLEKLLYILLLLCIFERSGNILPLHTKDYQR